MKTQILSILLLLSCNIRGQNPIPWNYVSSGNTNLSSGNYQFNGNNIILGPSSFNVTSNAKVDVYANSSIQLSPASHFGSFGSTTAGAHFKIDELQVASFHANGFSNIPQYDRFELGVNLPNSVLNDINAFLNTYSGMTYSSTALNPYDPDKIKITCDYYHVSSNTNYVRHGFFFQDYTDDNLSTWTEVPTNYKFRIRFAPPKTGVYRCTVKVYLNNALTLTYENIYVNVNPSNNPGHLDMAGGNLRKLKFENNSVFFGIGQGIPGPEREWSVNFPYSTPVPNYSWWKMKASPKSNVDFRTYLNDLANKGGNFVRTRFNSWGVPFDAKDYRDTQTTSGVYNEAQCLNNYQHNQMFYKEFDESLQLCETHPNQRIYLLLALFDDGLLSQHTFGHETYWIENPYSNLISILRQETESANPSIQQVIEFFTNPSIKAIFRKQLYYINARWGYSTSLGLWKIINETEHINHFQDPNPLTLRTDIRNWVCEMKMYLETFYPWHPTTNGTIEWDDPNSSTTPYGFNNIEMGGVNGCLNVYSSNAYSSEVGNNTHQNYKDNIHERGERYFNQYRPYVHGELGLTGCPVPDGLFLEAETKNDRSFHNNIWATTVDGSIATGLNWWDASQSAGTDHRANFPALRNFVNSIDWDYEMIPQRYGVGIKNEITGANGKTIYNLYMSRPHSGGSNYVVGWSMMHPSYWAYDQNYSSFSNYSALMNCYGYTSPYTLNDYDISGIETTPPPIQISNWDPWIEIRGLKINTPYRIDWYDTYGSPNGSYATQWNNSGNTGIIKHWVPFSNHWYGSHPPDRAYIIVEDWSNEIAKFSSMDTVNVDKSDSLLLSPNLFSENLVAENTSYSWTFSNGESSNEERPSVHFNSSGNFSIKLDITTASGDSSTHFEKDFVVSINDNKFLDAVNKVICYPNPAREILHLDYDEKMIENAKISLIAANGALVRSTSNSKTLDLTGLQTGLYILNFKSNGYVKSFKVNVIE